MPRSGILSQNLHMFSFSTHCQPFSKVVALIYILNMSIPVATHPDQHLVLSDFAVAILVSMWCYYLVVLTCISLTTNVVPTSHHVVHFSY